MYSWEKKFGDVVNDTEKRLSKARQALDSASYRNGLTAYFDDSLNYDQDRPSNSRQLSKQLSTRQPEDGSLIRYSRPSESSGGMVALLSEKIERQGKAIEDLSKQVLTLQRENEKGAVRVRSLEQEVTTLRQRMSENGVHLPTEEKVDRFQWEVKEKLAELKQEMEIQRRFEPVVSSGREWRDAITSELHELKRQVERECDSLYQEIEVLRAKFIRYDVDLSSQHGDTKELARRVDKLKEEFHDNSSKVAVQLDSISSIAHLKAKPTYGWSGGSVTSLVSREGGPSSSSPRLPDQNHRRRRKKAEKYSSGVKSLPATSAISSKRPSVSELLSTSTDELSSDIEDDLLVPNAAKQTQGNSPKGTDNSLTLSDLELGDDDNHLGGSERAFELLSIDSDSLDLNS